MRLSEKINGGSTSTFLNKLNESEDFNYDAKDAAIDFVLDNWDDSELGNFPNVDEYIYDLVSRFNDANAEPEYRNEEFYNAEVDYKDILDEIKERKNLKESNTSTKNAIDELVKQPNKFKYQMLDRLKSDCEYFLGNGHRNEKDLWADNVEEQIAIMKALWNSLEEKPEWLSMKDIENYEKEMKQEKNVINESITNLDDAKSKIIKWYKDKDYDCETIMDEAKRYMTNEDWHYMKADADDTIGDSTFEEYYFNRAINEVIEHISAYMDTDSMIDWAQTLTLRESEDLTEQEPSLEEKPDTTKGPEARKTIEDQLERNYDKKTKIGIEESEDFDTLHATEYLYTDNIDKYRNKNVIIKADLFLEDITLEDFKEEAKQNNVKILDISEPDINSVMDVTFEGNIEDIAHLYGFESSDEMAKMTDVEVKLADNIEESENLKESTIRKFSADSEEFKALSAFADELNKRSIESRSSVRYRVDDCYFDFGQNWWWTTVLATNGENGSITGTWQCLSPAQHEKIIRGNSDEVLEQVLASSDKLTK